MSLLHINEAGHREKAFALPICCGDMRAASRCSYDPARDMVVKPDGSEHEVCSEGVETYTRLLAEFSYDSAEQVDAALEAIGTRIMHHAEALSIVLTWALYGGILRDGDATAKQAYGLVVDEILDMLANGDGD